MCTLIYLLVLHETVSTATVCINLIINIHEPIENCTIMMISEILLDTLLTDYMYYHVVRLYTGIHVYD